MKIVFSVERAPGGVETLVISGIAPTDAGRYQVMAKSVAGKASVAADLIVVDLEADVDTDDEGDGKRRKRKKRKVPEHERKKYNYIADGREAHPLYGIPCLETFQEAARLFAFYHI
ncbi:hypothetical protein BSL78_29209 [Apostichopus japonicus]|uniref:Immunoglobulin I-set domain-containing protein n=1 Tax=Stichopus japonicus TaxID=307972 RepID=A0A2G8JDZ0_STIJA|nr:hypothetical protein BSL78_29209 [Apostichopus japonicus]